MSARLFLGIVLFLFGFSVCFPFSFTVLMFKSGRAFTATQAFNRYTPGLLPNRNDNPIEYWICFSVYFLFFLFGVYLFAECSRMLLWGSSNLDPFGSIG